MLLDRAPMMIGDATSAQLHNKTITACVRIQGKCQEDLVFIEFPGVSLSTAVWELIEMVKAREDVQDECSPLLLLGATLFRKALREKGDPDAEITHHLRIDQSLLSLGIGDEEELVMVCTTTSNEDAIVRLYHQQEYLARLQRQQNEAARQQNESLRRHQEQQEELVRLQRRQQEDTERLSSMMRDILNGMAADRAERQRAMGGAEAWCNVGNAFASPATSIVNDNDATKQQCRVKALECFLKARECDPENPEPWTNLAKTLVSKQTIEVAGETLTKPQCLAKAVEKNPRSALAWQTLGICVPPNETVEVSGKMYSYAKAVECNPQSAETWRTLALSLSHGETVEVAGKSYKEETCYAKALGCDPHNVDMWHNVGFFLSFEETVEVDGKAYTKPQCCAKAVECDPRNAKLWRSSLSRGNH